MLVVRVNRLLTDQLQAKQSKKIKTGEKGDWRKMVEGAEGKKEDEGEGKGDGDGWKRQPVLATCGRPEDSCDLHQVPRRWSRRGREPKCARTSEGSHKQLLRGREGISIPPPSAS